MPELNQPAPDFTLTNTARETVSLSSFRGQKVVLAFVPAAFTGVCTKEFCTFRDQLAEFNGLNAQVLGISVDPIFSLKAWAEQNDLNFPLLTDYKLEAVNAYGTALENFAGLEGYTASHRAVFIVDEAGNLSYKWQGENPGVFPPIDDIKAALA